LLEVEQQAVSSVLGDDVGTSDDGFAEGSQEGAQEGFQAAEKAHRSVGQSVEYWDMKT
jgi:hypothetical protein